MVVTISQEGMIFFNDERMTMDALPAALRRLARTNPGATLLLEADGHVFHDTLIQVYNMAVAGIEKVTLATRVPSGGAAGP